MGCVHANDNESYTTIPRPLFSLLLILWKFIILMLTQVDTCNFKYSQEQVWRLTLTRFAERCNALHYSHHNKIRQAINRDSPPSELVEAHSHPGADCTSREGRQVHLLTALH